MTRPERATAERPTPKRVAEGVVVRRIGGPLFMLKTDGGQLFACDLLTGRDEGKRVRLVVEVLDDAEPNGGAT